MKQLQPILALLAMVSAVTRFATAAEKPAQQFSFAGPYTAADGEAISRVEKFVVAAGEYSRLTLEMDVVIGPWQAPNADAWHNLFWMTINGDSQNLIGYSALRRPQVGVPLAMLRQGLGMAHDDKSRMMLDAKVEPGMKCRVTYTYDVAAGSAVLVVRAGREDIVRFSDTPLLDPAAKALKFSEGDSIQVVLSTPAGENKERPSEAPAVGWTYSNLKLSLYLAR